MSTHRTAFALTAFIFILAACGMPEEQQAYYDDCIQGFEGSEAMEEICLEQAEAIGSSSDDSNDTGSNFGGGGGNNNYGGGNNNYGGGNNNYGGGTNNYGGGNGNKSGGGQNGGDDNGGSRDWGRAQEAFDISKMTCGAFTPKKLAHDLGISSTHPIDIAEAQAEGWQPWAHQAAFEGCLAALGY